MNLSQIAVVCRNDLYWRSLWHGLAWRWHSKNDTSRNGRGHGQCFDTKHDKILLFSLRTNALTKPAHDRIQGILTKTNVRREGTFRRKESPNHPSKCFFSPIKDTTMIKDRRYAFRPFSGF
ncbi:MAG: hypothetical protein E6G87_07910 [Alphaproteobacteria bacterium]|nr:MAG: hypothetical protein E6G87_07910 [Alphaproteobacteria bacterium]